jgi:hypothetical protein
LATTYQIGTLRIAEEVRDEKVPPLSDLVDGIASRLRAPFLAVICKACIEVVLSKKPAYRVLDKKRSRHAQWQSPHSVSHIAGENLCGSEDAVEAQELNAPRGWAVHAGHGLAKSCPAERSARPCAPLKGHGQLPGRLVGLDVPGA